MKGKFFAPLHQRYVVEFLDTIAEGRCRTGKMMMYDPETGHRIKDYQQLRRSRGDVNVISKIRYSQAGIDGHGAAVAR